MMTSDSDGTSRNPEQFAMNIMTSCVTLGIILTAALIPARLQAGVEADLSAEITADSGPIVSPGDVVRITFSVTNLGPDHSGLFVFASLELPVINFSTPFNADCSSLGIGVANRGGDGYTIVWLQLDGLASGQSDHCSFDVVAGNQPFLNPTLELTLISDDDPNSLNDIASIRFVNRLPPQAIPSLPLGGMLLLIALIALTTTRYFQLSARYIQTNQNYVHSER